MHSPLSVVICKRLVDLLRNVNCATVRCTPYATTYLTAVTNGMSLAAAGPSWDAAAGTYKNHLGESSN